MRPSSSRDEVFTQLRLWRDDNHDGVCQLAEMHTLPSLGIVSISLDYRESRRTDRYGNWIRYRARAEDAQHTQGGRWAWDVFLRRAR